MSLVCSGCSSPLPAAALAARDWECTNCAAKLALTIFPALWRASPAAETGHALSSDSDAACFFHTAKRAEVACDACGRFICSLCAVELGGGSYCPACIDSGDRRAGVPSLETHRTLWDRIALAVAVLPMLIFYVTLVTAPVAIFLSIRHWSSPGSLLGRSRWRFVVAIVLGGLQLFGMVAVILGLVFAFSEARTP
ncbi:MAG: hypothetical protein ABIV06_09175 [Thermoanaerobaculia bacterium]